MELFEHLRLRKDKSARSPRYWHIMGLSGAVPASVHIKNRNSSGYLIPGSFRSGGFAG